MSSILRTEHLSYEYGAHTPFVHTAVKDLSVDIEQGECIGIIGHTGSGKSTLVQLLNGLLKPSAGSVYLNEKNIWDEPKKIREIRFQVGLVFQYPEYQLFEETVQKDIAFGPKNMGLSEKEIEQSVLSAAEFVGLDPSLLQKSPFDLSGGEKRRAAIAGVIAMNPKVLILDEPTAGLDPQGRVRLLTALESYHKKSGNTILLVTHNMEDIVRLCDRLIVLSNGSLVCFDRTEKVFADASYLQQSGLRAPQITEIAGGLAQKGYRVDPATLSVESCAEQILSIWRQKQKGGQKQ